jgi:RHS repeat-associated protein
MAYSSAIAFISALLASTTLASAAVAQNADLNPPPREALDENGVDLALGRFRGVAPELSIGTSDSGLSFRRSVMASSGLSGWTNSFRYALYGTVGGTVQMVTGDSSTIFIYDSGSSSYVNQQGTGETLTVSGTTWTFKLRDSTTIVLDKTMFDALADILRFEGNAAVAAARTATFPNKEKWTFNYRQVAWDRLNDRVSQARLQSVQSSNGFMAKYQYADNGSTATQAWRSPSKVTLLNSAIDYCNPTADSCTFSTVWPSLTFTYDGGAKPEVDTVTDSLNRTTTYTFGYGDTSSGQLKAIRRPTSATNNVTVVHNAQNLVQSVAIDGRTWNYGWSLAAPLMTATVTNPDASQKVYVTNTTINQVTSVKDELNRTTTYQYDTKGRLTDAIYPEGNKRHYIYDARGNITQGRLISKTPGTPSDSVVSASFPATCANPLTCNQPTSFTDARGNVTNYTYDPTHGGVLTVTSPAPTAGAIRPQTRFTYVAKQAYYKSSGGSIVASGQPTYLLSKISECQTLSTCAGVADETKTTIDYGPQVTGTRNNLFPIIMSKGSGNGSLTATVTNAYDNIGNLTYVDGPLSGNLDQSRILYDAVRQVSGMIGPDPDGAGNLKNRAVRNSYNLDGRVTKIERGTTSGQTDTAWNAFQPAEVVQTAYDASGRKTSDTLKNGTTSYALTQFSYDNVGRLQCSTERMNPAVYGSLPGSACTLGTQGSDGPDRIHKIVYDAAGEIAEFQEAVGTVDAATERTLTWTSNGQLQTLKDAESNLTTYEYDGFDRLVKTRFPVIARGANQSSTTDYEMLGYDAGSNVISRRLRDGNAIAFIFDKLDRTTLKDLPGAEPDATFGYDNLGRLTSATQVGLNLSFTYDALSRNLTQVGPQGTTASAWDLAGRRSQLTYPGSGLFVNYDYLVTGEVTRIRENGATSGVGVLATYAYDALGRQSSLIFGNGVEQAFTYDAVSRLGSLTNDLSATANDLTVGPIDYNPASQIRSVARTGDPYAWTAHSNESLNGTSNGLNQLTTVGAKSLTHDARGNVTAFGTKGFTYTSENLVLTGPNSTALSYDPLLRLYQTQSGATTRFAYDNLDRIAEYDGSNALQRRYVHGPGDDEPIVWYEGSGTADRRFLSSDERGSVISVTDSSGGLLGINSYDEYGVPASANLGVWGYTGQAWLPGIGEYYYKARVYDPELGRFLQTDPDEYEDSPNLYAYVLNDPINAIDPLGLQTDLSCTNGYCGLIIITAVRVVIRGGGAIGGTSGSFSHPERVLTRLNRLFQPKARQHKYRVRTQVCKRSLSDGEAANLLSRFAGPFPVTGIPRGNGYYLVSWLGLPGGMVQTTFSATRLSVTNVTTPVHAFVGRIDRAVVRSGGATYITTHGSGNAGPGGMGNLRDVVNESLGPEIFGGLDSKALAYAAAHFAGC